MNFKFTIGSGFIREFRSLRYRILSGDFYRHSKAYYDGAVPQPAATPTCKETFIKTDQNFIFEIVNDIDKTFCSHIL